LQVLIVAEEWKQADSSEACRKAKVCLLTSISHIVMSGDTVIALCCFVCRL